MARKSPGVTSLIIVLGVLAVAAAVIFAILSVVILTKYAMASPVQQKTDDAASLKAIGCGAIAACLAVIAHAFLSRVGARRVEFRNWQRHEDFLNRPTMTAADYRAETEALSTAEIREILNSYEQDATNPRSFPDPRAYAHRTQHIAALEAELRRRNLGS